jgi:hypothetical protein
MSDNVYFEEKDVKPLDYILTRLKDGRLVQPDDLLKVDNLVPKGTKKKELDKTFEHYVPIIQEYCGEHVKQGFGTGFLRKDARTVYFYNNGGFGKELEDKNKQKKKVDDRESVLDEINRLTVINFELDKEKKLFDRKIRKWKVLSLILTIVSVILTIALTIKSGIL